MSARFELTATISRSGPSFWTLFWPSFYMYRLIVNLWFVMYCYKNKLADEARLPMAGWKGPNTIQ
jgi:hypothetical protein